MIKYTYLAVIFITRKTLRRLRRLVLRGRFAAGGGLRPQESIRGSLRSQGYLIYVAHCVRFAFGNINQVGHTKFLLAKSQKVAEKNLAYLSKSS